MNPRWLTLFGGLNLVLAPATALIALVQPGWLPAVDGGLWFSLVLQAVLGAALVFCGQQIAAGKDLGHKAYPAVCVAYILFLLMVWRWLS